jgi:hypothetical protein
MCELSRDITPARTLTYHHLLSGYNSEAFLFRSKEPIFPDERWQLDRDFLHNITPGFPDSYRDGAIVIRPCLPTGRPFRVVFYSQVTTRPNGRQVL